MEDALKGLVLVGSMVLFFAVGMLIAAEMIRHDIGRGWAFMAAILVMCVPVGGVIELLDWGDKPK